jgi:uncharacterized protein (UPF0276 family)
VGVPGRGGPPRRLRDPARRQQRAGHTDRGSHLLDTHSTHVCDEVWELYRFASRRIGAVASLVEWDEDIPDWDTLEAESARARDAQHQALFAGAA